MVLNNVAERQNINNNFTEFLNYYLTGQLPFSVRKEKLKENILNYLEEQSLKKNLRALYQNLKDNWLEIRNLKILIEALKQIVKFIDEPTYKNLDLVKWLAKEFVYSDKIFKMRSIYLIFRPLTEDDNLGKAIIPMIKEILKGCDFDSDSDSGFDSDSGIYSDDLRMILSSDI